MFTDPKANQILEKGPSRFSAQTNRRIPKTDLRVQYSYDPIHGYEVQVYRKLASLEIGTEVSELKCWPRLEYRTGKAIRHVDSTNRYGLPSDYWEFEMTSGGIFIIPDLLLFKQGILVEWKMSRRDKDFDRAAAEALLAGYGLTNINWKEEQAKACWIWVDRKHGTHHEANFKY